MNFAIIVLAIATWCGQQDRCKQTILECYKHSTKSNKNKVLEECISKESMLSKGPSVGNIFYNNKRDKK